MLKPISLRDNSTRRLHSPKSTSSRWIVEPEDPRRFKRGEIITSLPALDALVKKMWKIKEFAFDTEADVDNFRVNGPNKNVVVCDITISWGDYNNYDIPFNHIFDRGGEFEDEDASPQLSQEVVVNALKPIFEREDITLVGHNIIFDMHILARLGIKVKTKNLFCTMIASWICNENTPNGLKENTLERYGVDPEHFKETLGSITNEEKKLCGLKSNAKGTFPMIRIKNGASYCMDDSYNTWRLYLDFLDELEAEEMETIYYKMYPKIIRTVFRMEEDGVELDWDKLPTMKQQMQEDIDRLTYMLYELAGIEINLNSNQQKAELLFGWDGAKNPNWEIINNSFGLVPVSYSDGGKSGIKTPQTGESQLLALAEKEYKKNKRKQEGVKFCDILHEYGKLTKLMSFLKGFEENKYDDGRIHCRLNIIGTDSGRFSCQNPNMQQLPNSEDESKFKYVDIGKYKIRSLLVGDPLEDEDGDPVFEVNDEGITVQKRESIISVDYSNLEVRVMAHFSKDPGLLSAFAEGKDLHGNTACMMFKLECHANEVKKKYPHLRQIGKIIAFLLQYGGSAPTLEDKLKEEKVFLAEQVKDAKLAMKSGSNSPEFKEVCERYSWTKEDVKYHSKFKDGTSLAQDYIDKYFEGFSGIADFMKSQKKRAHKQGYVKTVIGRKRRLPNINGNNYRQTSYEERLALNAPIQGSGADIIINAQNKISGEDPFTIHVDKMKERAKGTKFEEAVSKLEGDFIVACERLEELGCKMKLQIHDELLFSCPEENCNEAIAIIRECMIHPFGYKVELNQPLEVGADYGSSYDCGH